MKTLYYNSYELPQEIRIISKSLGIQKTYTSDHMSEVVDLEQLFRLAKSKNYDDVSVRLSARNMAYLRNYYGNRKEDIYGWISLKNLRNGGDCSNDNKLTFYEFVTLRDNAHIKIDREKLKDGGAQWI